MNTPIQKIFFGPPGCGKSYRVRLEAEQLGIIEPRESKDFVETTFHPEYGYGDFVAKLMPATIEKEDGSTQIEYQVHAGPLIKAIARAKLKTGKEPVLLVIDEINRGNCAQIFGDIFHLLDRNDHGESEYGIDPSDLVVKALKNEKVDFKEGEKLRLPPNLSIIGTMNTSDESVYYMDTAFKRRWDFEHMSWEGENVPKGQKKAKIEGTEYEWEKFAEEINKYIALKFNGRNIDDKQIGIWFLRFAYFNKNIPSLGRADLFANRRIEATLRLRESAY